MARHGRNGESGREAVLKASAVYAEHGDFIKAMIGFLAKNQFRTDDYYQEFFLSLVRHPVPADVKNVRSYLYQAIRHDILDWTRKQAAEKQRLEKHAQEIRISIYNHTPTDAIVLDDERISAFRYLTRHLCRREAEAVMLRYRDNCSIAEIASEMGVDKRTVSRYLTAALDRLRRGLVIE